MSKPIRQKTPKPSIPSSWLMGVRLAILQLLSRQPGYQTNQNDLLFALRQQGFVIGVDKLRVELAWLDQVSHTLIIRADIAMLTDTGLAATQGARLIPGIRPPFPHEIFH